MKARPVLPVFVQGVVVTILYTIALGWICLKYSEVQAAVSVAAISKNSVIARLTRFEVKQNHEHEFRKALSEYVSHAILQRGNIMAEAYSEEGRPEVLWLIERWTGAGDVTQFTKSKPARLLEGLHKEALIGHPKVYGLQDLEPLTVQQWRTPARNEDQPITIMLFVDALNGTQKEFTDIYHVAMPHFRGEPGVVTYQLSRIEGDITRFVTYEKFRSPEAFEYHLNFHAVRPVIDYLEKNVKHPPFQNGLHKLVEIAPMTRN